MAVGQQTKQLHSKVNPGFSSRNQTRLGEVNRTLSEIASTHGKTASQVALSWLMMKENVVAIPRVKRTQYAVDDAGAVDWSSSLEMKRLEKAAAEVRFDSVSAIPNLLRFLSRRE